MTWHLDLIPGEPADFEIPLTQALLPAWREYVDELGGLPVLDDMDVWAGLPDRLSWLVDKLDVLSRIHGAEIHRDNDRLQHWLLGLADRGFSHAVSKPRRNLEGLADKAHKIRLDPASVAKLKPAPFDCFQPFYEGQHLSTDTAYHDGQAQCSVIVAGWPSPRFGEFVGWHWLGYECGAEFRAMQEKLQLQRFVREHLPSGFTGVINEERIGGNLIEVHFRPSLDFFPMWPPAITDFLIRTAAGQHPPIPEVRMQRRFCLVQSGRMTQEVKLEELGEQSWREGLRFFRY